MIIGVTGLYCSGKDTVAEILQKMGFFHVSFSDILREELRKQKKEVTREALIDLGNTMRKNKGPEILSLMALVKVMDGENYCFTSIRNSSEVEILAKRDDFLLINVSSPIDLRLKRILQRNREKDPKTLAELKKMEEREFSDDVEKQQMKKVMKLAKITVINDSSIEAMQKKIEKLVSDNLFKLQNNVPDWDHYFMGIAEAVKARANCLSAKKGAIIVFDKKILSTGYNGSPKSIQNCNKGGCERCKDRHLGKIKSGQYSKPCICVHAEANAIVQAAYNGMPTRNAIMYCTFTPCTECAKLIINAGISEVVAKTIYPDDVGTKLLKDAGIIFRVLK